MESVEIARKYCGNGLAMLLSMAERLIHDTAFAIASALTEKLDYKLVPAEQQAFHRLVYETCKAAIRRHDEDRNREAKRVQGRDEKG